MSSVNLTDLSDSEILAKLRTPDGQRELLGASQGVGFRMKRDREIPQNLFEFGFIEHDRTPIFSITRPEDIRHYNVVVFDKGPLAGKSFEL